MASPAPVFEDLMAISHGKPLLDFFDTQMATSLLRVNKEVSKEVVKHAARYPFPKSLFTITKNAEFWFHWNGRDYRILDGYRLSASKKFTYKPVNGRYKKVPTGAYELRIEPEPYKGWASDDDELYQYADDGEYIHLNTVEEAKWILRNYKDIQPRWQAAKDAKVAAAKAAAAAEQWRRTHVFPLVGSTKPTNPWTRKN